MPNSINIKKLECLKWQDLENLGCKLYAKLAQGNVEYWFRVTICTTSLEEQHPIIKFMDEDYINFNIKFETEKVDSLGHPFYHLDDSYKSFDFYRPEPFVVKELSCEDDVKKQLESANPGDICETIAGYKLEIENINFHEVKSYGVRNVEVKYFNSVSLIYDKYGDCYGVKQQRIMKIIKPQAEPITINYIEGYGEY